MKNYFSSYSFFLCLFFLGHIGLKAQEIDFQIIFLEEETGYPIEGVQVSTQLGAEEPINWDNTKSEGQSPIKVSAEVFFKDSTIAETPVQIIAYHKDYEKKTQTVILRRDSKRFVIKLSFPTHNIKGRVFQQADSAIAIADTRVRVIDSQDNVKLDTLTDEFGRFGGTMRLKPGATIMLELIHKDYQLYSTERKEGSENNTFEFFLLKKKPPLLRGRLTHKKSKEPLKGIPLKVEKLSIRSITDEDGQYAILNNDTSLTKLSLVIDADKIGKFPYRRDPFILKHPRKRHVKISDQGLVADLLLKDNYIINQPKWMVTAGFAASGLLAHLIANSQERKYVNNPRDFDRHKKARFWRIGTTSLFSASIVSAGINILFFKDSQVTSRVFLSIN